MTIGGQSSMAGHSKLLSFQNHTGYHMATAIETRPVPKIRHTECFIGGKWLPAASGKTFATINPATEEVIADVAEELGKTLIGPPRQLERFFETSIGQRWMREIKRDSMYRLADLIEQDIDELAALESLDNGKPIKDARAAGLAIGYRLHPILRWIRR